MMEIVPKGEVARLTVSFRLSGRPNRCSIKKNDGGYPQLNYQDKLTN
jgi:hypothetical protein